MISKKDILFLPKMIKLHILKRKCSNLNIEELWIQELIMKEETLEWLIIKKQDLNKNNIHNLLKIIWEIQKNSKENIWKWFLIRLSINTEIISKPKRKNSTMNYYQLIVTRLLVLLRTGHYLNKTDQDIKHYHYQNGIMN